MKRWAYSRQGMLAINPRAFLETFLAADTTGPNTRVGTVEIVDVCGPLDHHEGWWSDSYEGVRERFDAAIASDATQIILRLDSPGGEVSGCFELARYLRETAIAAGKPLLAYVDGQACSAAYALACAAQAVWVPPTGFVGSIGVINARADLTASDAQMGVKFAFTLSGPRKADGNPHQALSEDEQAATQETVDSLAALFFDWVKETRNVDAGALDARVFHGTRAVAAGLADQVGTFDALLASLAGEGLMTEYEKARAALQEAAKGDGDDAKRAQRALAAMDESEDDAEAEEKPADDDAEAEEKPADDDASEKEKEKDEAVRAAGALGARVNQMSAELAQYRAEKERTERKALFAKRPDLSAEFRASLADLPLAAVKKIIAATGKPRVDPAAAAAVTGIAGQGQGGPAASPSSLDDDMDVAFGLKSRATGVKRTEGGVTFGVLSRADAEKLLKEGAK